MKLVVLPQAAQEFEDAAAYYDRQEPGLGGRFREEVAGHVRWIVANASVPSTRPGGYRRVNLKVFPYYLSYQLKGDTVWILAVAHGRRKPEYWISRR